MKAWQAEKAFTRYQLGLARHARRALETTRGGLFISHQPFPVLILARLLQDIAAATLAELRLRSILARLEEKIRAALHGDAEKIIRLGSLPEPIAQRPCRVNASPCFGFFLALAVMKPRH